MRESNIEGVASHGGPEPCVVHREGQSEASAGDRDGWPLSRERALVRVATRQHSPPRQLERRLGYSFARPDLLSIALTHPSAAVGSHWNGDFTKRVYVSTPLVVFVAQQMM